MMQRPSDHPPARHDRIAVLLVNLGTPDAPEPGAVRCYLRQFLSDRRVVEIPPLLWQLILRGIILRTRPAKSAANYAKVWGPDGSPLLALTQQQGAALQNALGDAVTVRVAMRYGQPALGEAIRALHHEGHDRILIAPLYPQYCAATTATVVDEVGRTLTAMRWQPTLRFLPPYYADDAYIGALAESARASLKALSFAPNAIVASFHGMPERTLTLGDPYHCHCQVTARKLAAALGHPLSVAFQSRFGRAKWLEPSLLDTLSRLAEQGQRKVAVIAPGFAVDCIETLEEVAMEARAHFLSAGGTDFAYLPALNADAPGITMLESLIRRELLGWFPQTST